MRKQLYDPEGKRVAWAELWSGVLGTEEKQRFKSHLENSMHRAHEVYWKWGMRKRKGSFLISGFQAIK